MSRSQIVIAAGLGVAGAMFIGGVIASSVVGVADPIDPILRTTRSDVEALLTADPARPESYADTALAVTTGSLHARLQESRTQLVSSIAAQKLPSFGQVVSAGVMTSRPGHVADVLIVASASNPALIGLDATSGRLTLRLRVTQSGSSWKIASATLIGAGSS